MMSGKRTYTLGLKRRTTVGLLFASAALLPIGACVEVLDLLIINNSNQQIVVYGSGHPISIEAHSARLLAGTSFGEIHVSVQEVPSKHLFNVDIGGQAAKTRRLGDTMVLEFPILNSFANGQRSLGEVVKQAENSE